MKGLTVIATHNGFDYLEQALEAEKKFGKWPVVVIDTASDNTSFRLWAEIVCQDYGVEYVRQVLPHYDFGAYMLASTFDFDAFWFKHDSLYLKSSRFYDILEKELPKFGMIGWHFFARWGSSFDNDDQQRWLIEQFGTDNYDYGFYGPNLAIKKETLDLLRSELEKVVVDTKIKQQAMERGWAILGKKHNLPMMFLEQYKGDVQSDRYEFFRKAKHTSGAPRQ